MYTLNSILMDTLSLVLAEKKKIKRNKAKTKRKKLDPQECEKARTFLDVIF